MALWVGIHPSVEYTLADNDMRPIMIFEAGSLYFNTCVKMSYLNNHF